MPLQNSPRRTYDQIRSAIRSGIIIRDDQLVEDALSSNYATSRNSVREALQTLAQEGLVTRSRGRGTIVSGVITELPMENVAPVMSGASSGMRRARLSHEIREIAVIPASPNLRAQLGTDNDVLLIEQVALLDQPVYVGAFYYVCPTQSREEFVARVSNAHRSPGDFGRSLPATHGVDIGRVEVTIEAIACDSKTARLLGVEVGSPILLRERLVHDAQGRPVSLSYVHFSARRVALATTTYGLDDSDTPITS